MINTTINNLEKRLKDSVAIDDRQRQELLALVRELRTEITSLSQTHKDEAESIAGFVGVTAHEATRHEKKEDLMELSLEGLSKSVQSFEASHPKLIRIVDAICTTLSKSGV